MSDAASGRIAPHPSAHLSGFRATPEYIDSLRLRQLSHQQQVNQGRPFAFAKVLAASAAPPRPASRPAAPPSPSGHRPAAAQLAQPPGGSDGADQAGRGDDWPVGPRGPVILRG